MSDTLTTLKELAAQVRGATRKGENTAERVGRLFVGILALMEESEISFEPSEGYDTLGTLKELAAQVRRPRTVRIPPNVSDVFLPASWICWSSPVSSSILPKEMIP